MVVYPKSHQWGVQKAHMLLQWTLEGSLTALIDRLKRYEGSPPTGGQPIDDLTLQDITTGDEFLEDIGQYQTPTGKAPLPVTFVEETPEIRDVGRSAPSRLPERAGLVRTEAEKESTHPEYDCTLPSDIKVEVLNIIDSSNQQTKELNKPFKSHHM